jgi:hypothetical protein
MASDAGAFAGGQGVLQQLPPSRIVRGALALFSRKVEHGLDIGPD